MADQLKAANLVPEDRAERYRSQGWWPGESLLERFRGHVASGPDQVSVTDSYGTSLTRRQLWERAESLSEQLRERGVVPGDVVVVYLPNSVLWQAALLACLQLAAVPATLPVTTDQSALAVNCRAVGTRAIVTIADHHGYRLGEVAAEAAREAGLRCEILIVDDDQQDWVSVDGPTSDVVRPVDLDHLMFTSSTTGSSKAVMHTADTLAAVNIGFAERFGITEDTPIFMPSPLGHSVGAWHGGRLSLFTGAHLVLQDRWHPRIALELVDEHRCEFTAAATPFLKDLVEAPWDGPKFATMRNFLCGGAAVPESLMERAATELAHTFVTVLWGMTEGGVTTCLPDSTLEQRAATCGVGLPGLELATVDPDGTLNPEGGELVMRGPGVFVGYLGQEQLYADSLTEDGYFRTGDLATVDEAGFLRLTGRLKDLIVRGGVNISPVRTENALAAHPGVRSVAVIGIPDDRLGERICAVITPQGPAPTLAELVAFLTDAGLPRRLMPESLVVRDDMPTTAAGKIRKVDVRKLVVHP
ncbi:AMP-binding protein [Ornithinimicrobium ciconiae]|uniref:AMP-binding protein n=1 Tax=Ornithinimicrobium ciconiae TaxID=2594265 RepID=A0A516G902_9MICO|nr:AMP-binding protein [Ornithinimicrobium ciconiae]QDO88007.1 AMP-binding protein [Ornithinimicrobium ciconiae]